MKPRRDITLGEMQDECKKYWNNGNLGSCGKCQYMEVCCHYESYTPAQLKLTDPPRFTEAQMAIIRGMFGIGTVRAQKMGRNVFFFLQTEGASIAWIAEDKFGESALDDGKPLDLAELLGKDGEK